MRGWFRVRLERASLCAVSASLHLRGFREESFQFWVSSVISIHHRCTVRIRLYLNVSQCTGGMYNMTLLRACSGKSFYLRVRVNPSMCGIPDLLVVRTTARILGEAHPGVIFHPPRRFVPAPTAGLPRPPESPSPRPPPPPLNQPAPPRSYPPLPGPSSTSCSR